MPITSIEDLILIVKAIVSGKDGIGAIGDNPILLLLPFMIALLTISGALVRNRRYGSAVGTFAVAVTLGATFYMLQGHTTRVASAKAPQDFTLHAGKAFYLGDLAGVDRRGERMTLNDCQIRCAANAQCAAFTFDDAQKACHLKGAVTTMHNLATAVSGIKRDWTMSQR